MQVGMIGLGRMGLNMVRRLLGGDHRVVAYNRTPAKVEAAVRAGARGAYSLSELTAGLTPPRAVWLMLPAGPAVDEHLDRLKTLLSPGDIVIDGGNSFFKDSVRRAEDLSAREIFFLDVGISGGVWGLKEGYCLMAGGSREAFNLVEPLLKTLAPSEGYLYCGPSGAGHFVKMIHNGIEYGLMQAYAEGFALLRAGPYNESLDLAQVSRLWNQGSVIRSWLLELAEAALSRDPGLDGLKAWVEDSGEGRWTVQTAVEQAVSIPVITLALMERFRSRSRNAFADRFVAALRREFGGHAVDKAEGEGE